MLIHPTWQEMCSKAFGGKELSTTMNADECVARGPRHWPAPACRKDLLGCRLQAARSRRQSCHRCTKCKTSKWRTLSVSMVSSVPDFSPRMVQLNIICFLPISNACPHL